ncbi:MAG: deoxyribose-phosphate aldolase [Treponema sp.]|nr:deoxyribose-phosphate aldolase [Treponema sp.]
MTNDDILARIDHTLLRADATWEEIEKLAEEGRHYKCAAICIPPSYVERAHIRFGDRPVIASVAGFPLGYDSAAAKMLEAETALHNGASEIDMVINLGHLKNGDHGEVEKEIRGIKKICGERILKVIIETCYLTEAEKILLCKIVSDSGADYIKTSTGFGSAGATLADIELFKKHIGKNVKIKAAGGVKTREDLVAFIEAGSDRIGTSSAVKLLTGEKAGTY